MAWLTLALVLAVSAALGALAWAVRERRLRSAAEIRHQLAQQRLDVATRSLEARDAELASLRIALILAQQEVRESAERSRIAAASDSQVAADLAAALAARRSGRGSDLATCDTAPDLGGLAARTSATVPAGGGLPAGSGGVRGAGRDLTR